VRVPVEIINWTYGKGKEERVDMGRKGKRKQGRKEERGRVGRYPTNRSWIHHCIRR